jgi:protein tyrosine kinase modulator
MSDELRILPVRTSSHGPTLRDIAAVFFRQRRLVVISFLLALSAGLLYAILAPSYKAEMKVLVRHGRIDPAVTPTETAPPLLDRDEVTEEELNSEVELLQDDDILRRVAVTAGLADDPSWIARLTNEDGEERIAHAVKRLARKLEVQPVRKSHLITVSYKSGSARQSAAVLKALADAYLAKHVEIRRPSGQQTFFEQQMQQSRRALDEAEAQLVSFTRNRKVVSAPLERDLTLQKLSDAQSADLQLEASVAEAAERVRSLEAKLLELPERRVSQIRNADNPLLQEKLKSKLLELQLQRTELLTKFQPSYRLVEEVDQQISQAKAAIEAEDRKPLREELTEANPEYEWASSERMKALVELRVLLKRQHVARSQLTVYQRSAEELGESVLAQSDLEEKLKAAQDKFLLYSNKREEARIGDALDENGILNVALAQEPRVPALPTWPVWAGMCFSFVAACVLSTGTAFAADYLDPSLRTPDEVVELLGSPVLACLPAATGSSEMEKL